jgi:pimeloyl-ACP methyl ester carboxylesterase
MTNLDSVPIGLPQSTSLHQPQVSDWKAVDWSAHSHLAELAGGVTMSYVDIGEGGGPAIVLVHGLGGSWRAWLENIAVLATDRRVIAVDLPGFGASPADVGTVTVAAYARIIDQLCRQLGIDTVVVAGSSLGGWISVELALRAPGLVAGLVLIDAAGIPPTRRERIKVVTMLRIADRVAPFGARHRETLIHNIPIRRRALRFAVAQPDRLAAELVNALLPDSASPVFRAVLNAAVRSWSVSWCNRVTEIGVPALVLWGAEDAQLPVRHGTEWTRLITRSHLVVIQGAGHLPMLEAPAIVNREMQDFLAGLEPTATVTALPSA